MINRRLTYIALAILGTGPALAQVPDDVARIDVLSGWRGEDGAHRGALAITLAPGWKTYWRAAGEGGIPPAFNWSGSRNLGGLDVHFPVPRVFDQNGMRSYGYEDAVVLPFLARPKTPGSDIALSGQIEIGVCLDVCVPVSLTVTELLPAKGAGGQVSAIRAAFADRPMSEEEARVDVIGCRIEPISDGMRVTAEIEMSAIPGDFAAVMELPDPSIWVSEATVRRTGATLVATAEMVPPAAAPFFLARDSVRITLLGPQAIEIEGCD